MQQLNKKQIGSIVAGVIAIAVLTVGGFFAVKAMNKTEQVTVTNTECFSISTPASYKVTVDAKKCQFSAYTGTDRKNPDNLILILPYQSAISSVKEADAALLATSPTATRFLPTKIGHKPAEAVEGTSKPGTKQEKHVETYVAYNLDTYDLPEGKTNAFRATFIFKANTQPEIIRIVKSITWK